MARLVPLDRLLVETDCPYLSPPGAPRRRNTPTWVGVTAAWVAEQRNEDPARLATSSSPTTTVSSAADPRSGVHLERGAEQLVTLVVGESIAPGQI